MGRACQKKTWCFPIVFPPQQLGSLMLKVANIPTPKANLAGLGAGVAAFAAATAAAVSAGS